MATGSVSEVAVEVSESSEGAGRSYEQGMSNTFTPNNSRNKYKLEKMGLSPMNSSFQLLSDGIAGSKSDIFRFWTHPPGLLVAS